MAFDRFMIAPLDTGSGLQTNFRPWLIPDQAFAQLNNAYVFRGRVRKRFGSTLLTGDPLTSRFRINVGTTNGSGNILTVLPGTEFHIGQLISIGTALFTVTALGIPANLLRSDGVVATATLNTTTGALIINGAAAATDVFFYPALPVMGLSLYEFDVVFPEVSIGFDTEFAYQLAVGGGAWLRAGTAVWTGTDSDYFWTWNWRGVSANSNLLFATNYNILTPDPIRYWDGATWTDLTPAFNSAGDTIRTCQMMVGFKNRLLFIGTLERISGTDTIFQNRLRFSQNGSPLQSDAWREDIPGKGGFIDCSTQETVVTCTLVRDRLIVYFETSVWEVVYTNNEILPFRWQQLNVELGAFSRFSHIPIEEAVIAQGETGIHVCNGVNVKRIDQLIPDVIFQVPVTGIPQKIYGVRDYQLETVYWSMPVQNQWNFCNKVLVFNYKTGTWAFNDDSFTAFGYFEDSQNVMAGNQEGYTFNILADVYRNAPSLQITNITYVSPTATLVVIDHNLIVGDYILIENALGITTFNNNIYQVVTTPNKDTLTITALGVTGTYLGGGTIARVSRIDIFTKQYNFYVEEDRNAALQKTDFFITRTDAAEISIDYFVGSSTTSLVAGGVTTGSIIGTSVLNTAAYALYPYELTQARLWHPTYQQADGESIQLRIYLSNAEMIIPAISLSNFELHAMTFYCTPTASRLQ